MKLPVLAPEYLIQFQEFERKILANHAKIEAWFRSHWNEHRPPFYGSVDIRNAGYKISSIDMNLFPGGFNNLNPNFIPLAAIAAQDAVQRACETAKSVLIIPENHTRNTFYLQNVYALSEILRSAGYEVRLGSLNPEVTEPTEFETALGDKILLEPLLRTRERVHLADGFSPCVVLLNNDLSAGVPDILKGISQTVLPPLHGGWTTRRKTEHFSAYNQVAAEFAKLIDIDEWQINPYFEKISGLDFQEREGEDALAGAVERVLAKIQAKYDELGITDQPFVIVKADAGTYGMGVMSVKSADEVRGLNRKNRNKMAKVKEGFYEFDKEQKKQTRAVYVCKSLTCLGRLAKHNKVKLDSQDLMAMLSIINKANKNYLNILNSMKNSGELVFGINLLFENIEHVHFIVLAQDISKKNEEKILRRISELKIPYVTAGTMEELGKIFNKEEITVIGIKDKKMARGLIED